MYIYESIYVTRYASVADSRYVQYIYVNIYVTYMLT